MGKASTKIVLLGVLLVTLAFGIAMSVRAKLSARDEFAREIATARDVLLAIRFESIKEPERTVEKLDDLVTSGALDEAALYRMLPDGTRQPRWNYFGHAADREGGQILIVSTRSLRGNRIVGTSDTSVELMKEDFFQSWAREHGVSDGPASSAAPEPGK